MAFNYEIVEDFGTISKKNSYSIKLRKISYNGRQAKYDLRKWRTLENGEERMLKGVTLSETEFDTLITILNSLDF